MRVGQFAAQLKYSVVGVLVFGGLSPLPAGAQHDQSHALMAQPQQLSAEQKRQAGAFVRLVRESTERFRDVAVAEAEDYKLQFGCVSGSDAGAVGQLLHLFESPNRFGLPAFYTLHVWAWKDNPNGTFVNWHPQISCDGFSGQNR
jgi:hypothetical protein